MATELPGAVFDLLKTFGVGLPGQRILDLGTGVGFLALRFAQGGALSTGVDIAHEPIQGARSRAESLGVAAEFYVAAAEETELPTGKWTAGDLSGDVPFIPRWSEEHFRLRGMFAFDEQIPFTWESWRGRIRACRGIGATLKPEQIKAFDAAHDALLRSITPERFSVLHRIDAHLLRPIR